MYNTNPEQASDLTQFNNNYEVKKYNVSTKYYYYQQVIIEKNECFKKIFLIYRVFFEDI